MRMKNDDSTTTVTRLFPSSVSPLPGAHFQVNHVKLEGCIYFIIVNKAFTGFARNARRCGLCPRGHSAAARLHGAVQLVTSCRMCRVVFVA